MSDEMQPDNSDATSTEQVEMPVDMVPNPMKLDPKRFRYNSQEVVLYGKYSPWLRLTPMVMPVGVTVTVTFPDRTRMDFCG